MSILRVAVIGAGQVARTSHINHYKSLPDVEICAVCDVNQNAAKMAADEFHIPSWYTDAETMLKEIRPDAVSICVPNKFHCDMTCLCLEYGCHVLCEKPPAVTLKEAERMRDTARRCSRILTFGFHFRHAETIAFLKKKVEAGEMGTLYAGDVTWLRRRGIPGWGSFTNLEIQGGGPLIDIGAHMLDLAVYLLDYPEVSYVCASSSDRIGKQGGTGFLGSWDGARFGVEDSLFGFIHFSNGGSLTVRTSFTINIAEKEERNVRLYGDKRGISVFPFEIYGDEDGHQVNSLYPFEETKDWHYDCIRNFVESCMGRADILVTPDQAVYVQKLITGLYQSAGTGRPVIYGNGNL